MEFKVSTEEYKVRVLCTQLITAGRVASSTSPLHFIAALDACSGEVHSDVEGRVVLQRWFRGQGVSEAAVRKVLLLCDPEYLLAQRRPPLWNRRGNFGGQARLRYFSYRHAARLLGWCERKEFPCFVRDILKLHIFPTVCTDNEENGTGTATGTEAKRQRSHSGTGDGCCSSATPAAPRTGVTECQTPTHEETGPQVPCTETQESRGPDCRANSHGRPGIGSPDHDSKEVLSPRTTKAVKH